jgi:hypothetical protein
MSTRTISVLNLVVSGSALAIALGGCDAGNAGRVLSAGGAGNTAGNAANGGNSALGTTSDVAGNSNGENTGGATTTGNTGGAGLNINQAKDATALGTWTPASISSGGVTVNVSNNGTSTLRVQIQGPSGATDATDRWCATMITFNQTVTIPWSSFNTSCWDGLGTRYAGQPLEAVMILVPGDNLYSVPYSFCLNSISG